MALLAESLVEEWLNRQKFFTIRGIKHGVDELDLLAIRRESAGTLTGWHVEVQASFRPVGYISKRTREMLGSTEKRHARTSALKRTAEEVEMCAREWVRAKFHAEGKVRVRDRYWPDVRWSYHLVHAAVREPAELMVFEKEGVECHEFHQVLSDLLQRGDGGFSGSAGGDLAEVVGYYTSHIASRDAEH